jgi:hypothetical protein
VLLAALRSTLTAEADGWVFWAREGRGAKVVDAAEFRG